MLHSVCVLTSNLSYIVDHLLDPHWIKLFAVSVLLQEQKFCQRYDQLMEAWEKKVERIESNPRRRAKESKVREYYEKQFPEIRKQREMQERMQRWDHSFFVLCLTMFKKMVNFWNWLNHFALLRCYCDYCK